MTDAPNTSKPAFPTHIIRRLRHKAFGAEERIVLFVLADRMKNKDDAAWPKVETIALDCGISERTARDVIAWLLRVGVLLVWRSETDTGGARAMKIDFEVLTSLPEDVLPRSSGRRRTPTERHGAPVDRQRAHADRNGAHREDSERHGTGRMPTGAPLQLTGSGRQKSGAPCPLRTQEGTKKEPVKEPNSARGAARVGAPVGPLFESQTSPEPSPIQDPIPAPPTALPAASEPSPESLPTPTSRSASNPLPVPAKRGRKRKYKSAVDGVTEKTVARSSGLTEAQGKAFREVTDCFVEEFKKEKGESPILEYGGRDRKVIQQFLEKCNWDASKACEIIRNAFGKTFFRERLCSFGELLKNTTRYQGKPESNRRPAYTHNHNAPTQQMEPADWVPSASAMEDFYS